MPIPLSSNEIIHVDHKIKEASYSMPHMQAASDHYMLGYLVSGDRKWFSYENIKIAHFGDVGISKPNVYHRNCAMSDIPYERYIIKFRLEALQPAINLVGQSEFDILCTDYLHFLPESQIKIKSQFEEMYQEYNNNTPYSQLILTGMLHKLFFTIYQEHLPIESSQLLFNKFDSRIHDVLVYIENNLEYNPTIDDAAKYISLSTSHFSRLFKEVTGCSYTDYLTATKLQHAQLLLGNTQLSISQIAYKTGFSNANYLATVFQKKFNCSPSKYRKTCIDGIF